MPSPTPITLTSPLPEGDLLFESMNVTAGLSLLGEMQLGLLSPQAMLKPEDLLGKTVCVTVELRDETKRFFHGHVTRFGLGVQRGRQFGYQATVRPWLWFLTRTSDCRIFQEKSVPDIVKAVFEDHGVANFELNLFRSYKPRTYCVQYRESDYNFVARLLEEEGIYWYFKHSETEHKLVLIDALSAHDPVPGYEMLPFYDGASTVAPDTDYVSHWHFSRGVTSGAVVLRDYDFERPSSDLTAQADVTRPYDQSDAEVFDYPGHFIKTADGLQYADNQLDEMQTGYETLSGVSNAQGLEAGHLFELTRHPREDQNGMYLLTQVAIQAAIDGDEAGSGHSGAFHCQFSAMPSRQQFRPPRRTPKPFVQGPQTAMVTGTAGEEIDTDQYGRIKVQFHWDRLGKKDEKSSCWVRVAQIWAGKNFGGIFIPRIGQEVIVDFLEGDPDQPIVTGRVYNGEQMPPWKLPDNKTQSGILSRSSKGGGYDNANAIRFEDKKGAEQVWIQAEKDMSQVVENDETASVGRDRTRTVTRHEKITVGKGREVTVEAEGETYKVTGPRLFKLTGHENEIVTDGRNVNITGTNEEYTTGSRKMWTSADFIFKSTKAYVDAGPEWFLKGTDLKFKASGGIFVESAGDQNFKAANFKFGATGNFDFFGNKYNRTIMEGNDTVLGANTNTYIGSARSTNMGPSVEAYLGMSNSAVAGIAVESFLGMQISNVAALTMANETLSLGNTGISLGMTGVDLTVSGIGIDNNAIKLLNGGGASGAGAGSMLSGAGAAAMMAAAVGGGFALGFGGAAAADAISQAKKDIQNLLDTPGLTPETKARLQRYVDNPFSTGTQHQSAESYSDSIPQSQVDAQMAALEGRNDAPAGAGGVDANGVPNDPTTSLGPPPAADH
jgi:type VI secretion system secreted protein VgrG